MTIGAAIAILLLLSGVGVIVAIAVAAYRVHRATRTPFAQQTGKWAAARESLGAGSPLGTTSKSMDRWASKLAQAEQEQTGTGWPEKETP